MSGTSPSAAPRSHQRRRARRTTTAAVTAIALAVGALTTAPAASAASLPAFDAVDPFIGTGFDEEDAGKGNDAYGNTYPGATVPFGMVQSSPTTYRTSDGQNYGGYEYSADEIRGFGLTRLSGTGCRSRYGGFDFPVIPYTGGMTDTGTLPTSPASDVTDYYVGFSHDDEVAEPGYYSVGLDNGVDVSLTATTRTAVSSFDFSDGPSTLVFDAAGSNNTISAASIEVDAETNTITGTVTAQIVCQQGASYTAYMSASFDADIVDYGTWSGGEMTTGSASASSTDQRHGSGAWVSFAPGTTVTATIGLSYVSVDGAAANAAAEVGDATVDEVRDGARDAWTEALGTIDVGGGTDDERTEFYTALYHSLLHPNTFDDADGRYTGYDGEVHRVEDGRHFYVNFSSWDTYRSQAQLVALLFPDVASDINQSIVDMVDQTGVWTSWPSYNQVQTKMTGDSLQVVVAAMDAFGATDYDRESALASMVSSQSLPMTSSNRTDGYQDAAVGWVESRRNGAATSRVLEYAVDDFSIAQLAQRLGDDEAYEAFSVRAQNWRNIVNPETQHIDARDRSGFTNASMTTQGDQFEQSTGGQYGWSVPFDMAGLIEARGGVEAGVADLDALLTDLDAGAFSEYAYLSNQPSFGLPWVYTWLQKPSATVDTLYRAVDEMYDTTPTGLPGNDDLGSLSSWLVWAHLGIMPAIYGTADLVVSAPMFDEITISSIGSDRVIEITAPGVSSGQRYTSALAVDGVEQTATWVPETFAQNGGSLEFTMSRTVSDWGTGADDVPPSYDEGSDARGAVAITSDGAHGYGSTDMSDNSLSRERLAAAGLVAGETVEVGDVVFTWPDTDDGEPDSWVPHGQRIELEPQTGTGISFLGLATNGPSTGTAVVEYADGTTQDVEVSFADWASTDAAPAGNTVVATTTGRNQRSGGTDSTPASVFATAVVGIDPERAVVAVTLPTSVPTGIMHVFDVALENAEPAEDPDDPGQPDDPSGSDDPGQPDDPSGSDGAGDSAAADEAGGDTGALPVTGASIAGELAAASALLAAGAILLLRRRRRA